MQGGAMTPAAEEEVSASQSSVPLLSRRRGSLSASSTLDTSGNDIGGGSALGVEESIIVRVKTAGDGREYKLSTPLTATVSEVSERSIRRLCLSWQGSKFRAPW